MCQGQDIYIQEERRDMETDFPMTRLQIVSLEQCKEWWEGSWERLGK